MTTLASATVSSAEATDPGPQRTAHRIMIDSKHPILSGLTSFMKKDVPVYEVAVAGDEVRIGPE
jgi:hypothetical protein